MELQVLAAVIAFAACLIAVVVVSKVDPSRRRKVILGKGRELTDDMLGLEGPRLKQWLAAAGFFHPQAALFYTAASISAALIGGALGGLAALWVELPPLGVLFLAFAGAFLVSRIPSIHINRQWERRSRQIADSLPLMFDMMEVCSQSGNSLDEAWSSVQSQMQGVCPALAEEMELVELEYKLGRAREHALRSMAERTGVGDLAALASMLAQSERFGTGLAETFRAQATSMRQDYARALEEQAYRSTLLAVLPVVVLMLPAMLLVTIIPLGIVIVRAFDTEIVINAAQ